MAKPRGYCRRWEAVLQTCVSVARTAALRGFPWEPELSWAELARRYVLRSERRTDARLVDACRLTHEAGAALTHWGLASGGPAMASSSRIRCFSRTPSPASSPATCTSANAPTSGSVSLPFGSAKGPTPVAFDLRWSIAKSVQWLTTEPLFTHH